MLSGTVRRSSGGIRFAFVFPAGTPPVEGRGAGGKGGQASRPIRTGQVKPSRVLRLQPVNPVVFRGP